MSDYKYITKYDSRNYTPASQCVATFGFPRVNKSITFHWWGTPGKTGDFDDTCRYLLDNAAQTSSNYVAEAGKVACIVDPDDASHANGHARGNAQSITIEMNPRASKGEYRTAAQLVANLREVYGDIPLHGHNYWTATACPGHYDLAKIDRMARRRKPGVKPQTGKVDPIKKPRRDKPKRDKRPAQKPAPKHGLYWTVEAGDTLSKIAEYYAVTVRELVKFNGIKNPNRIRVGQHVKIPAPLYWTVQRGDSIEGIAAYYGMSYDAVAKNAGLVGKRPIIGTTIRVY